jgi:hypothetical protein
LLSYTIIAAFESQLAVVQQTLSNAFTENGYVTEDVLVYQYDASGNIIGKQYAEQGCSSVAGTGCPGATNDTYSFFYDYDNQRGQSH